MTFAGNSFVTSESKHIAVQSLCLPPGHVAQALYLIIICFWCGVSGVYLFLLSIVWCLASICYVSTHIKNKFAKQQVDFIHEMD